MNIEPFTVEQLIEALEDCPKDAIVELADIFGGIIDVSVSSLYDPSYPNRKVVYLHRED